MSALATALVPAVDTAVVARYRDGDAKVKGQVRAMLDKRMKQALNEFNMQAAIDAKATLEACTVKQASAKVEIDPKQVVAQRISNLLAAADMLSRGLVIPTDLDVVWSDADYVDGFLNLPTVEADEDAAKVAGAKLTRTALRRSIDTVVERAFEDMEDGDFLTVSQIRARGQWEGYVPSDGAIAARLFPQDKFGAARDCTLIGVTPVEATASAPRGAVKGE